MSKTTVDLCICRDCKIPCILFMPNDNPPCKPERCIISPECTAAFCMETYDDFPISQILDKTGIPEGY